MAGNSDLKFPPGWFTAIDAALANGAHLVGPVTNAPGHKPKQHVARALSGYKLSDVDAALATVQSRVEATHKQATWPGTINGFCMVARTDVWWSGAFDSDHVFNPKFKMTRNEDELQGRWLKVGRKIVIVPGSFVYHYRSVSRGKRAKRPGKALKRG